MKIIHVCANPKPVEQSVSKQMAARFFGKLMELNPDIELNNIDLYQEKPPFYSNDLFRRMWMTVFDPVYEPSKAEDAAINYASKQTSELKEADVLVLTTPMWNFGVPAVLKAWIDQVIAPGLMFEITDEGPKPLHNLTAIVLLVASGGVYKEDDDRDALTRLVRSTASFIGVNDVRIAWADGQNPLFFSDSAVRKELAFDAAEELAEELADEAREESSSMGS